jgi:hypothetical protein
VGCTNSAGHDKTSDLQTFESAPRQLDGRSAHLDRRVAVGEAVRAVRNAPKRRLSGRDARANTTLRGWSARPLACVRRPLGDDRGRPSRRCGRRADCGDDAIRDHDRVVRHRLPRLRTFAATAQARPPPPARCGRRCGRSALLPRREMGSNIAIVFERIRTKLARRRERSEADEGDHPLTEEERQQLNYRPIDDPRIFRDLFEPPAQGDPGRDRF